MIAALTSLHFISTPPLSSQPEMLSSTTGQYHSLWDYSLPAAATPLDRCTQTSPPRHYTSNSTLPYSNVPHSLQYYPTAHYTMPLHSHTRFRRYRNPER